MLIAAGLTLGSCSKWIDVKPTDRLSEDVLYQSKEGYLKALNGIYVEMSSPALYGQFMTAGVLDVMGQYYMTSTLSSHYLFANYDYTQSVPKASFDQAWSKAYSIIFNLNVLLEHIGEAPTAILPDPYYSLIKGEALAIRAYLHFDLLRLFGPAWTDQDKGLAAIPYYVDASRTLSPLYSSEQVMAFVLQDLSSADQLLAKADPILTSGVGRGGSPDGNNAFSMREYRLNYYALQALKARVYLWGGDKEQAGTLAKETIAAVQQTEKELFPFVSRASAIDITIPDRMFSTEVLFSMYTINRTTMYNNLFSPSLLPADRLAPNSGSNVMTRVDAMYDDKNDYRYRIWDNPNNFGVILTTNQKFKDVVDGPGRYMIPMIRIGELYLIAAECSSNITEAVSYLNTLRLHRNAFDINPNTETALAQAILTEHRKEMIGEGQQFFYYKRRGILDLPNPTALTGTKTVSATSLRVPLPDSEISLRN